jgi:ABC-type uncharacterized transport system fused permease/ATPase subunit
MSLSGASEGYNKISGYDRNIDSIGKNKISTISLATAPIINTTVAGLISDEKEIILQCNNLSIFTPDGLRTLLGGFDLTRILSDNATDIDQCVGGVNFEIFKGERVLVSGPSGCGKSSLLRAISGLWELGGGKITWNIDICDTSISGGVVKTKNELPDGVFFLPQKPYNLLGSLRQQIAYPGIYPGDDDGGVVEAAVANVFEGISFPDGFTDIRNPLQSTLSVDSGEISYEILDLDAKLLNILQKVRLDNLASRMGSGDERLGQFFK